MKRLLIFFLPLVVVLFFSETGQAQINKRRKMIKHNRKMTTWRGAKRGFNKSYRYHGFGVSFNSFNYFGDLTPASDRLSTDLAFTRPAFGLFWEHRYGPRYSFSVDFKYGTLRGDDFESADSGDEDSGIFRYARNLHFRNRIKELTFKAIFDLKKNEASYISRVNFTPYVFGGITVFHHNPQAIAPPTDLKGQALEEAGEWVDLHPLGTEGQYSNFGGALVEGSVSKPYKKIQLAIPLGLGIRVRLNEVLDFSFETSFRYLFTDYIDDVGSIYLDLENITAKDEANNELARAMSYRSGEAIAAVSGGNRFNENYNAFLARLAAAADDGSAFITGGDYTTLKGYGSLGQGNNLRGDNNTDFYIVNTLKVSYILGNSFLRKAKFR